MPFQSFGFWVSFCGRSIPIGRSLQGRKIPKVEKVFHVPTPSFPRDSKVLFHNHSGQITTLGLTDSRARPEQVPESS